MRKASFSVESLTSNSSIHNLRIHIPKYLIETNKDFNGNFYKTYINKEDYLLNAQKLYKNKIGQKMQMSQVENFYKEAVISMEGNHTETDIENLFNVLNKKYGGHKLVEIAIHKDEGHFVKDDIEYYPTKHILLKDNDWFICSNFEKEELTNDDFDTKVDIKEFKKVHNYHCHATFTMFDEDLCKSARMQKKDMMERFKIVADTLGLLYAPDKNTRLNKKHISTYKNDLSQVRNEKLKAVNKQLANQKDLKLEIAKLRVELKDNKCNRSDYAKLEQLNKELQIEVKENNLTINSLNNQLKNARETIFNKNSTIDELTDEKKLLEQNMGNYVDNYNYSDEEYKKLLKENERNEEIFLKLDEILLSKDEKIEGKEFLKGSEIVDKVATLKKENNLFKRILNNLNNFIEMKQSTLSGIFQEITYHLKKIINYDDINHRVFNENENIMSELESLNIDSAKQKNYKAEEKKSHKAKLKNK